MQNNIYQKFWSEHINEYKNLIYKFLENPNEGGDYYEPSIRGAHMDYEKNEPYLTFNRVRSDSHSSMDTIVTNGNKLLDFHYLASIIQLFFSINDNESNKWTSYFAYKRGKLEYIFSLIDKIKRDEFGNVIYSKGKNPHPISIKGKHIKHIGQINSPVGLYEPYNNIDPYEKYRFGNKWNRYFNPEFCVYDANRQLVTIGRSKQTGNGQFQLHWFPKTGSNVEEDLNKLAELISSIFAKTDEKTRALFLAFLIGVDNGTIKGYQLFKSGLTEEIIRKCENIINPPNNNNSANYHTKQKYTTNDDGRSYNTEGQSSDEDMEYQINNLSLESIIRNKLHKLLIEKRR